jgi:hypothetical protein
MPDVSKPSPPSALIITVNPVVEVDLDEVLVVPLVRQQTAPALLLALLHQVELDLAIGGALFGALVLGVHLLLELELTRVRLAGLGAGEANAVLRHRDFGVLDVHHIDGEEDGLCGLGPGDVGAACCHLAGLSEAASQVSLCFCTIIGRRCQQRQQRGKDGEGKGSSRRSGREEREEGAAQGEILAGTTE